MSETNKALAKKMLEMIWNEGKVAEAIAECRAPSCVSQGLGADAMRDQKQYEEFVALVQSVITDTRITFDQMIAEGDKVAFRATLNGKSKKTGKPVVLRGFGIARFADGKIVEASNGWDGLSLRAQLRGDGPESLADVFRAEV